MKADEKAAQKHKSLADELEEADGIQAEDEDPLPGMKKDESKKKKKKRTKLEIPIKEDIVYVQDFVPHNPEEPKKKKKKKLSEAEVAEEEAKPLKSSIRQHGRFGGSDKVEGVGEETKEPGRKGSASTQKKQNKK